MRGRGGGKRTYYLLREVYRNIVHVVWYAGMEYVQREMVETT